MNHKISTSGHIATIWRDISSSLVDIYKQYDIFHRFKQDEEYLRNAFEFTEALWEEQFNKVNDLKVIMISEAPLFGIKQTYIYNPNSKPTAFFYYQDLNSFPNFNIASTNPRSIHDKKIIMFEQFIKNGFLILDIFPFAFNPTDTVINYRRMGKRLYNELLSSTADSYLIPKMKRCLDKMQGNPCFVYRYKRLYSKTGFHVNHILGDLANEGDQIILKTVNGTNMSLDREKLSALFK